MPRSVAIVKAQTMAIGRVVPWSCWQEWTQVYADLFSASSDRRQQALAQVEPSITSMQRPYLADHFADTANLNVAADTLPMLLQLSAWRSRGKVPLGVDITALLVEAQLRSVCPRELCLPAYCQTVPIPGSACSPATF